jgi:hypothetical protein
MLALAPVQKITANQACRTDDRTSLPSIASPKSPVLSSIIYAVGRNQLHPPCRRARLNRHRPRCTDGASPSATSCIEALPTPAAAHGAWSSSPASANLYTPCLLPRGKNDRSSAGNGRGRRVADYKSAQDRFCIGPTERPTAEKGYLQTPKNHLATHRSGVAIQNDRPALRSGSSCSSVGSTNVKTYSLPSPA